MKILALETSTNACSVALIDGEQHTYSSIERFKIAPRQHTQLILPMIDSVLGEAELDIKQIDVLAFGCGPGAFTGVRVGTGVIQALSYGAGIPVAQISSLAAIAQRCYSQTSEQLETVLVASDARMKEIYFAAYQSVNGFMTAVGFEQVMKPEDLSTFLEQQSVTINQKCIRSGSGWSEYSEQLTKVSNLCSFSDEKNIYPNASDIAYLAFKEVQNKNLLSAENVQPVYLRNNIAKKKDKNI